MTKLKTIKRDGRTYLVPAASIEPHAIQFEKVVRECPTNTEVLERNGPARRLITDYHIIHKGEHVATFLQDEQGSRTYIMAVPDMRYIRQHGLNIGCGGFLYVAYSKLEFLQVATDAIEGDGIPSPEWVDEYDAKRAEKKTAEELRNRKERYAEDMYVALLKLSKAIDVRMGDARRKELAALLKSIDGGVA